MNISNIDHLLEALHRDDIPNGIVMETQEGEYEFNWLDAASPAWLVENADKIVLALASKMVIRHTAIQEAKFAHNGYTGYGPIIRDVIPEDIVKEAEKHIAFYLKLKGRLEKLARLDSINRRSKLTVLQFPAKGARDQAAIGLADDTTGGFEARNLVETYELMRRSNLAELTPIVQRPGGATRHDWLDAATQEDLDDSTDTIVFIGAARLAIRMSIRLERGWRQPTWIGTHEISHTTDLHKLRLDRDRAVDGYLKIREAQTKFEHNQGIVARSDVGTKIPKPRRPHAKRKGTKIA